MIAGPGAFLLVALAAMMAMSAGGELDEKSPAAVGLGLLLIGSVILGIVGAGLGIAGLIQADRKKLFAVLGLVFNALAVLFVGGLIVLGLLTK